MSRKMWFGTEERMRWIPVPQSGADASAQSFGAAGTLLGGGGYATHAWPTHKNYSYSWSRASSLEAAAILQSYRQGTFGRGLIHFVEPTHYRTNVLPAQWADPSLALDWEAPPLRRTPSDPTGSATTSFLKNDLPVRTATYDLADVSAGFPGRMDSLFIPVPPGFTLLLGAVYTATGSGGVFVAPVDAPGGAGSATRLTQVAQDADIIVPNEISPGALGVRLWVGKEAAGAASVSVTALIARLIPTVVLNKRPSFGYGSLPYGAGPYGGISFDLPILRGPWISGQGHSGCRFVGVPTITNHSGVAGGQVGYAATLKEVGTWATR